MHGFYGEYATLLRYERRFGSRIVFRRLQSLTSSLPVFGKRAMGLGCAFNGHQKQKCEQRGYQECERRPGSRVSSPALGIFPEQNCQGSPDQRVKEKIHLG